MDLPQGRASLSSRNFDKLGCLAVGRRWQRKHGRDAKPAASNFSQWEIVLDGAAVGEAKIIASAEDAVGNVEKLPHIWASGH